MKRSSLRCLAICTNLIVCAVSTQATGSGKNVDNVRQFSDADVQSILVWLKSEALKPYDQKKAKGEALTAAENAEVQKIETVYALPWFRDHTFPDDKPPYSRTDIETFQASAADNIKKTAKAKAGGFSLKIRQSYSDLLAGDDTTVTPTLGSPNATAVTATKVTDLKGASLTYTRDIAHGSEVWAGKAAVLVPYTFPDFGNDLSKPFSLETGGVVPSVSLTKIASTDPATKNLDSLVYRAGAFATLFGPSANIPELLLRGWGTYATDTHNNSSTVAGEFDLEPRVLFSNTPTIAIGYKRWVPVAGEKPGSLDVDTTTGEDKTKWEAFNYQFRAYLHSEFGNVMSTGGNPGLVKGWFFRMGPALELKLSTPHLPRLNLTASYRYLPSITDSGDYQYFEFDADYALYMNAQGQRVSVKGSYINGDVELTSQRVETLLLGLGITY